MRALATAALALLVLLALPGPVMAANVPWAVIADEGGINTTVNPIADIAWDGTGLWLVWGTDNFNVQVRRWDGAAWNVYPVPVNEINRNKMPSVTWDGTKPWVAWNDDSLNVQIAWYDGASWVQIPSPGGGGTFFSTPDILWANGALHAAWQDSTRTVQIAQWNGSSWVSLGSPGTGGGGNAYPNLGWNGTELYAAWSTPSQANVARRVAGVWTAHSTLAGTASNSLPTLEFIGGRLYLMHDVSGGTALAWWDGSQYRTTPSPGGGPSAFGYGSIAWTGTRLWASYTIDPDLVEVAYVDPAAPAAPTALNQYQSNGTTAITSGAWTPFGVASNLVLAGTMADANGSEQLTPWIELRANGAAFGATCGQQTSGITRVGSAVAAPTGGVGVSGTTNVTGLVNGSSYAWRMCVVDRFGIPSAWTALGGSPDLRMDSSIPVAAPSSPASGATGVDTSPSLVASYTDPAPANSGTVEFQLCTTSGCGTVLQSGTSASTSSGANASWNPPSALSTGTVYWWRARPTDVAGNVGVWSAARSFTTGSTSITVGVSSGTVAFGGVLAGTDVTGTTVVTITTDSPGGYSLVARDEDDAWAADTGGGATVPDWTGTAAAPTTWNAGVAGGFGLTVLAVTGPAAKDPRWGTGTQPTDFATNKYAGLDATVDGPLHARNSLSLPADTVTVGWRLNFAGTQAPGVYGATIAMTAVAVP